MAFIPVLLGAGVPDAGHDFGGRGGPVGIQLGFPNDLGENGGALEFSEQNLDGGGGVEGLDASGGKDGYDTNLF